MGIWLGPYGKAGIQDGDFSYGGKYLFSSNGDNWELALLNGNASSLVFKKFPGKVDIFMVGGGLTGGVGKSDLYQFGYGGDGGRGGNWLFVPGVSLRRSVSYSVVIGLSDSDSTFSGVDGFFLSTVSGTPGSAGGKGAKVGNYSRVSFASAGADGIFAYNNTQGASLIYPTRKFCAGAGGADTRYTNYSDPSKSTYSDSANHGGSISGGVTGGGRGAGGITEISPAGAGGENTGSGGGAGSKDQTEAVLARPAAGGSGIILIRNAR